MADSVFSWENAYVEDRKILDYLLSSEHPDGAGKAKFFVSAGYTRTDWTRLRNDLLSIAREGEVTAVSSSPYGVKTVVDGIVTAPSAAQIAVRTVWINNRLDDAQKLVTAYPN